MTEDGALENAYNLGLELEKSGDLDGAEKAYREVLRLDPADHGGVAVRLAAMGRGPAPETAPEAYVATLFDQNARAFDDMLVEQLGYAVPMLLRERFVALRLGKFQRLLDLGCGTGLTGTSLVDFADHITGVDLAERMLEEADERDCYDALYVAEATAFLEEAGRDEGAPWNVITATDVLPYMGRLDSFFRAASGKIASRGILAISSESLADTSDVEFQVGAKHRFAHAPWYLNDLAKAHGFQTLEMRQINVRYDDGAPILGHLMICQHGA